MTTIKDQTFGGERPLFASHDVRLENIEITDGESGIKQCSNIEADNCRFYGKYPWWHVKGSHITNCYFAPESRSAIWYSDDMVMEDSVIDGPKFFREMHNLTLRHVRINDADETFWNVDGLTLEDVDLNDGTYPFMGCRNIRIDGLRSNSKYVFQYVKNVEIHNAVITTKDAFWETENVIVYDSEINGEYLAWHSKNIRFVRCHITGTQPLCYVEGLVLEDCTFGDDCDLCFEDSDVRANILSPVLSIKNPRTGQINCRSVGEVVIDANVLEPNNCEINVQL